LVKIITLYDPEPLFVVRLALLARLPSSLASFEFHLSSPAIDGCLGLRFGTFNPQPTSRDCVTVVQVVDN
jgi:hypothetical protein